MNGDCSGRVHASASALTALSSPGYGPAGAADGSSSVAAPTLPLQKPRDLMTLFRSVTEFEIKKLPSKKDRSEGNVSFETPRGQSMLRVLRKVIHETASCLYPHNPQLLVQAVNDRVRAENKRKRAVRTVVDALAEVGWPLLLVVGEYSGVREDTRATNGSGCRVQVIFDAKPEKAGCCC